MNVEDPLAGLARFAQYRDVDRLQQQDPDAPSDPRSTASTAGRPTCPHDGRRRRASSTRRFWSAESLDCPMNVTGRGIPRAPVFTPAAAVIDEIEQLAIDRANKAFGRALHQRAADVRDLGQRGGDVHHAGARRQAARAWTSDSGGHLTHGSKASISGQVFGRGRLRPHQGRTHRLRAGTQARGRAPAEADHLRHHRLLARDRLGAVPRDRRRGRRLLAGRHHAHRRPGRGGDPQRARSTTPTSRRPALTSSSTAAAAAWS